MLGRPVRSSEEEEAQLVFSRINDPVPNGIVHELMQRLNSELEHDSRPVRFYCSGANSQCSGYFLVALAQRQELNDLPLARGQLFQAPDFRGAGSPEHRGVADTSFSGKPRSPDRDRIG